MPRPLSDYNTKRDFTKTLEPPGDTDRRAGKNRAWRFVIQKYAARNLHCQRIRKVWWDQLEAKGP